MNIPSRAAVLILSLCTPVLAQRPTSSPTPQPQTVVSQDDVLRVITNLVQVDVVVTDNEGRQVGDLRPEDFEISENGKRQRITHFSYITATTPGSTPRPETTPTQPSRNGAVVGPARLRRDQVRRTIALVVDDLGLSFESIGFVRQALKKFVDEQMQPNDLVALLRTSAGVGTLQQFTSDKRQLYNAINHIRWYPQGRSGLSPTRTLEEASAGADIRDSLQFIKEAEDKRAENYSVGTFGALTPVVKSLGEMPGRKSLVLVSEAFRLFTAEGRNTQLILAMQRLTEQANAASVTIYTMDASGLQTDTIQAADKEGARAYVITAEQFAQTAGANNSVGTNPPPRTLQRADTLSAQAARDSGDAFRRLNALMDSRRDERFEAHTVLSYLASSTGGLFMKNRNDLGAALGRIMDDQKGYYLIGYRPDEDTIDQTGRRQMRRLTVKIKRSGVTWRTRSAYFGLTDEEKRPKQQTRDEQLVAALVSPFASGDIELTLTCLFGDAPNGNTYVRSLLHLDTRNLSLKEAGGSRTTELEIMAVAIGDNGQVVDQYSYPQTVSVTTEEEHQRMIQSGLAYILDFPMKNPGAYQMRFAVRDRASERLGAAMQYVEVPDLSKNRIALSGIVVSGIDSNKASTAGAGVELDSQSGPARRRLRQGMLLDYRYNIYNAQTDPTGRPQVQTQMRLFRDGQVIFTGKLLPLDASQQGNVKRLMGAGRLRLGPELIPGEYTLQVTAIDVLAPQVSRTAKQWADFEVTQ